MATYEETMRRIAARDAALDKATGTTASQRAVAKLKARRDAKAKRK
jgi:hypothetical protein